MPEKLHELQRQFLIEATRYKVLPLDDRTGERMNSDTAGRPTLIRGKTQLFFGGMGRLSENCVLNFKNKSHSVTAEIEVPKSGAEGVIVAQGANIGGWSLYAKKGKLKYCYNVAGVNHYFVESTSAIPEGNHQVRMEFAYAGGGLGKGGKVTLFVDGKPVGRSSSTTVTSSRATTVSIHSINSAISCPTCCRTWSPNRCGRDSACPKKRRSPVGATNARCWRPVRAGAPNIDLKQRPMMNRGFSISAPDTRNSFSIFASMCEQWRRCWKTASRHHA